MFRKILYLAGLIIILVMACLTVSSCGDLPSNAAATVNGKVTIGNLTRSLSW